MNTKKATIYSVLILFIIISDPCAAQEANEIDTTFKLEIIGWSSKEKYWAFSEEGDYGCGMMLDRVVSFYLINSVENTFYERYGCGFSEQDCYNNKIDEEKCYSYLEKQSKKYKDSIHDKLKQIGFEREKGLEVYTKPVAVYLGFDSKIKQFGEKDVTFKINNTKYDIELKDKILPGDYPANAQSMFSISVRKNEGAWHVLQADKEPWRIFCQYCIVYVSVSPSLSKIAIIVEAVENALEGTKLVYYKGITGILP